MGAVHGRARRGCELHATAGQRAGLGALGGEAALRAATADLPRLDIAARAQ